MTAASSSGSYLGAAGRARFAVTDRYGVRSTPSRPSALDPLAVPLGTSPPPFERLDLATHVGDDPGVVRANRADLARALGLAPDRVVVMDQVHGADVAVVTAADATHPPSVDAVVTATTDLALMVLVADCVPVVMADPVAGVVAVAHAGRRGVATDVVGAAVDAMRDLGAEVGRMSAVIGPAVCPACYEVPAAMRDEVAAVVPEAAAVSRSGTPALHLRRAVAVQLGSAGVGSIDAVGGCTAEDPSLYSYRRDGRTGRFAMLGWLPADAEGRR